MSIYLSPNAANSRKNIPRAKGNFLLGHTAPFISDVQKMFNDIYAQYGDVSRANIMFTNCVNLLGPDANELVLMNKGNVFSSKLAWDDMLDPLFRNGLMLKDGDDHKYHRKIMAAAFSRDALESYTELSNLHIMHSLEQWGSEPKHLFYPIVKRLTLELAAKIFMGVDPGKQLDQVNAYFIELVEASGAVLKASIPFSKFWRGIRARKQLMGFFERLIPVRRDDLGQDMLSRLIQAEDDRGNKFSDYEIAEHMVFIMMAAHDTTTSALSSLVYFLAKHRDVQNTIRDEANSFGEQGPVHGELSSLEYCGAAFKEALRMLPPLTVIPRGLNCDIEYKGYVLPKGQLVQVAPIFTHFMPEIWTSPNEFDPERFLPRRQEDKLHRFAYIPFGGGAHKCLGLHFAENQVKMLMFHLLKRFRIQLLPGYEAKWQKIPIVHPKDGMPVNLLLQR